MALRPAASLGVSRRGGVEQERCAESGVVVLVEALQRRARVAGLLASSVLVAGTLAACTGAQPRADEPPPSTSSSETQSTEAPDANPTKPPAATLDPPSGWAPSKREWNEALATAQDMTVPELAGGVIV